MGFECGPSGDSNDNSVEKYDVISESSYKQSLNSESFEKFIASSKVVIKTNLNNNKVSKIEKKWLKCILYKEIDNKNIKEALNKQMLYCNSAIESTLIKLNNYEGVLVFSYIFYKHRKDKEFIKDFYVLCTRWYFCLKYNFLISEAPYLGSILTFNSVIWGLKAIWLSYSRFILLLLGVHEESKRCIIPMLSYTGDYDRAESNEFDNDLLIEMCPIFSTFQSSFELTAFCKQFISYILEITFSLSKYNIVLNFNGYTSVVDNIWNVLVTWRFKSDCECQIKLYIMALDAFTDIVFSGMLEDSAMDESVKRLVGLYCKWYLVLTGERDVENSKIKRVNEVINCEDKSEHSVTLQTMSEMMDEIEFPYLSDKSEDAYMCNSIGDLRGFIEGCGNYVCYSYSRLIKESVRFYKDYESVPVEILVLACAYVNYEFAKAYDVRRDLSILDQESFPEPLIVSLYRHEIGRMILTRCQLRVNYRKYEEGRELEMDNYIEEDYEDVVSKYCYNIYSSIAKLSGRCLDKRSLKVSLSTTMTSKVESSYIFYEFPKISSNKFLKALVREVRKRMSSVSELSGCSDRVIEINKLSAREIGFLKSNSALPCAVIAIASLMNDDVYLDVSCEGVVRIMVSYRSVCEYSEDVLGMLLKLFYSEVEDDGIVSLEYNNAELAFYRTLLLRYILQLAISPINTRSKIRFVHNGLVDIKRFSMRFFKFLNFRTNSALMDRIVFEKYLTTRVVTDHKNRHGKMNLINGSSNKGANCGSNGKRDHVYGSSKRGRRKKGEAKDQVKGVLSRKKGDEFDSEHDENDNLPLSNMLSVFGFLEYYSTAHKKKNEKIPLKSEDVVQNVKYFESEYFFSVSFKLIGVLRNFLIEESSFASDVVDQFTFKYYLRLCSNDFYNTVNTALIYSAINQVLETNQYGEKIENAVLAQYFGQEEEGEYNGFMETLGLMDNENIRSRERSERKKSWRLQFVDLLKLNNRYTKRIFYTLTHQFCLEFFRFVPNSCLPNLLCSWAASLPTDTMSTVKSEKIATARFVVFMLICRICSVKYEFRTRFFRLLEPLVSAVNVVLVNLEIVYKAPTSFNMCEVISDDEHTPLKKDACIQSPQEFNELLSGELDVSDSNFYENIVSKYNTMRAENVKRVKEKREEMRRRSKEQVNQLLQVSWLFGRVMDKITRNLSETILDPENQYVSKTDDGFTVCCLGKRRSMFYSMVDLLTLVDNTLSTIIRICVLSTLSVSDTLNSEFCTPKRRMYSDGFQPVIKSEASNESEHTLSESYKESTLRNTSQQQYSAKLSNKLLETMSHSEIIGNIKCHKQSIKSRLGTMSSIQSSNVEMPREDEDTSSEFEEEEVEYISEDGELINSESLDDLDGFIDFETDQHLSMLTYSEKSKRVHNNTKNLSAKKRLKMSGLRSEWRCIIKSQLI